MKYAAALLSLAVCLPLCSCQTLSTTAKSSASQEPARLAPTQVATVSPSRPQPMPGRPVITPPYYPTPLPSHNTVGFMPAHHQSAPCPCCGPRGKFAFSDGVDSCGPGGCGPNGCGNGECAYRPYDEYICDGGDNAPAVEVSKKLAVYGLNQEDTIVHYDTLKGGTEWTASNKVCLYAPRFGAVRHVTGLVTNDQADRLADANKALPPIVDEDLKIVSDVNQPRAPIAEHGVKVAQSVLDRNKGLTAETTRVVREASLEFLPYEQLDLIRRGVLSNADKPRLAQVAKNAIVWTENQAVQVVIDKKLPLESKLNAEVGETVLYDLGGKPRMRIIKIADRSEAQPGDIVSFTLRFDNVGDQKVGNVTIIDNLTTRLEYVEGSQECSHKAIFHASENEGETAILRWEIEDPLRVSEGGIIRFKCRVR